MVRNDVKWKGQRGRTCVGVPQETVATSPPQMHTGGGAPWEHFPAILGALFGHPGSTFGHPGGTSRPPWVHFPATLGALPGLPSCRRPFSDTRLPPGATQNRWPSGNTTDIAARSEQLGVYRTPKIGGAGWIRKTPP